MTLKLAIAVKTYPDPTQTPATEHIAKLFGGESVVLCRARHPELPGTRPAFCLAEHRPGPALRLADHLAAPFEHGRNFLRNHNTHPPTGSRRRALEGFLRAQGVEAILAEFGTEASFWFPTARKLGLPFHVYFRGHDATAYLETPRRAPRRIRSYRAMVGAADGIFAVSQFLLDQLAARGITNSNAHVVPSGVDMARLRPAPKEPGLVIAAGRFIDKKAPEITVRAFVEAARAHPGARLEMIGDGPLLAPCQALARELGAEGKVIFHGHRPHGFVEERLRAAPLFLQHSVIAPDGNQEGAPVAIQEAMAAGACVISTRHAGIPHLVEEGVSGFLVDEHDAAGFAGHARAMLDDPARAARMGQAGHAHAAREFDRAALYRRVEAVLRASVVRRAGRPAG